MLRITIKTSDASQIWEREGRLSGEWVCELNRLWKDRSPQAGLSTEVHLKAVSYIDPAGKQLLAEMRQQGVEIRWSGRVWRRSWVKKDLRTRTDCRRRFSRSSCWQVFCLGAARFCALRINRSLSWRFKI